MWQKKNSKKRNCISQPHILIVGFHIKTMIRWPIFGEKVQTLHNWFLFQVIEVWWQLVQIRTTCWKFKKKKKKKKPVESLASPQLLLTRFHEGIFNGILTHYNTRSTQKKPGSTAKCMVRHKKARFDTKNARFDTKMPSPACTSWHCHYQTSPLPSCGKYFFSILFQYFVFKNQ